MESNALVSIIVRTCGKPDVLKNALESVRKQTYPLIEVVIIEDGPNISESFIKEHFGDLNYVYHSNKQNLGRTKAGNKGLELATGKYFNFLDEDDILLDLHVETLVNKLENTDASVAYSIAEEKQIKVKSFQPYLFQVKRTLIRYNHPFNRLLLGYMNLFPIQSVMFSRELFEKYCGFDEELDVLEDWDLWLRYALHEDFLFVPEVTSVYYTPFRNRKKKEREISLKKAEEKVKNKHADYFVTLNMKQVNHDMDYVLNHFNRKGLVFCLKKIQNYLLYHDR